MALIDLQPGYVLALITLVALPVALVAFARSGPLWRSVGKGPLAIEQEVPPPPSRLGRPEPAVDRAVQEAEARQMLEAKSYRRRRGEAPLDVEAEVARLLAPPPAAPPSIDEKLRAEVRQLVVARNERRMRRGEEPLDVDAELERQLADL